MSEGLVVAVGVDLDAMVVVVVLIAGELVQVEMLQIPKRTTAGLLWIRSIAS